MCLVLSLIALYFINFTASDSICGITSTEDFSPWIADSYGRLWFPQFNQESVDALAVNLLETRKNNFNISRPCRFKWTTKNFFCKGKLNHLMIRALQLVNVTNFLVTNYGTDASTHVQPRKELLLPNSPLKLFTDHVELPDNNYKGAGDIYSQELGIGMRLSINISPNQNYDGLTVDGDAFSNELRVGWRLAGSINITMENGSAKLQASINTIEDGGWTFSGLFNTDDGWDWDVSGKVAADFLLAPLAFKGALHTTQELESWKINGSTTVKPLALMWTVDATITPSVKERITIPRGLFKNIKIKNIIFSSSNFMGDFDKDALQDIRGLETITFIDSKLEEIPRLDYLLGHLQTLKAVYFQVAAMPNLKMGDMPSLPNLQLLSFKGSGPLQLDGTSFSWLGSSELKYLDLQDCNINIAKVSEAVLAPVSANLQYLDLSYTSLTEESKIEAMLRELKITRLSLAGLQLQKVPRTALDHVNSTLKYLSLRGNVFRKVPDENMFSFILDFPTMPNLLELDLVKCNINYIDSGAFDPLPNLKRLYLAYNNVGNIQEGWYGTLSPSIIHLDMSWNGVTIESEPVATFSLRPGDGLRKLKQLQIVNLSNDMFANVTDLVKGLPNTTSQLLLCNAYIDDKSAFDDIDLHNLRILDMSGNPGIAYGSPEIMSFLFSLQKLHTFYSRGNRMTHSFFTAIRDYTEKQNTTVFISTLTNLHLSGNNIKLLNPFSFSMFPNLKYVDLTSNSIASWSEPVMLNPHPIEYFKISDNKIEAITDAMFQDFFTVQKLELGRNPYQCDCNIKKLVESVTKSNEMCTNKVRSRLKKGTFIMKKPFYGQSSSKVISMKPKKCVELIDWNRTSDYYCYIDDEDNITPLAELNLASPELCKTDDFIPTQQQVADYSLVSIAAAVLLVLGLVVAFIYWKWWEIRLLTRAVRNAAILSFLEHEDQDPIPPEYSAFVSYCDKDRPWVLEQLLPKLEEWSDVSVCLHERDFKVGMSIMENITMAMEKSKNVVLVLSQSFLRSQWCQFELHLAQHKMAMSRRNHLLLIFLEPIPTYKKPKTLRYLMRTNTYLEWPPGCKSPIELERFWTRLFKSLSTVNSETISC